MSKHRKDRINEEVRRVISEIIMNEVKDPRISKLCSVISAEVTPDLKFAKVFISVLGSDEEKKNTLAGLNSAAGYVRKELGARIDLRNNPEVHFELDKSIEHGARILDILSEIKKKDGGNGA
ncbi:MAG: ribosome-binding factor A [Clostridiales bacterium GWB2_37_7]|nr:MAG: ribosome-binding factor A [Clostridiales bacterium GWB2_37_7]